MAWHGSARRNCNPLNTERACQEAVWLEHRLLLGDKEDMEDIVRAISKSYERRGDFKARQASAHK